MTTDPHRSLHEYDHAPDVTPADVDRCPECGRYAPHDFDHAPTCSQYTPIDDNAADTVRPTAADNPRMVRPHADGGRDDDDADVNAPQRPERIAAELVAAHPGDTIHVWVQCPDGTRTTWAGVVTSTNKTRDGTTVEHVVAFDSFTDPERRCIARFNRGVGPNVSPTVLGNPLLFDPAHGTYTIDRVEAAGHKDA